MNTIAAKWQECECDQLGHSRDEKCIYDDPCSVTAIRRQRALREGKRRWLYIFDDLTGRAFKVRRCP